MNISIIGAGNVGKALALGLAKRDYTITLGHYAPQRKALKDFAEVNNMVLTDVANAAEESDIMVLAVPWSTVPTVAEELAKITSLTGKILIDATNPLLPDLSGLDLGPGQSGGEIVQSLFPTLRVVKAFNTTGADNMHQAENFPTHPLMQIAGDDEEAKSHVSNIAKILGFESIDAGDLSKSLLLEYFALNWISLAFTGEQGTEFSFSLVHR